MRSTCASGVGLRRARTVVCVFAALGAASGAALAADPMASNNGKYPTAEEWSGKLRISNLAYPDSLAPPAFELGAGGGALTKDNAEAYAMKIKETIAPELRQMIEDSENWDPEEAGWYDLVWSGGGEKSTDGREALLNTYTGQIIPPTAFQEKYRPVNPEDPSKPVYVQNHAVIYYNDVSAYMLGEVFANLYDPDPSAVRFPPGSIVVKAEATTPSIKEWPILEGAATWHVYRPTTEEQKKAQNHDKDADLTPKVVTAHPLQMSIKVKDPVASPETEWVFMGFVYKHDAPGDGPWDKFVPLGVMWGNDPAQAKFAEGYDPSLVPAGEEAWHALEETWINPDAPPFTHDTLGWGDRLAGPMDVATRSGVITPSGQRWDEKKGENLRASSCMSCHGAAEFPFTTNLYPSPNLSFPPNGDPFLLYDPGSEDWQRWFQNRPGHASMADNIGPNAGLDYDMAIMFAISTFNAEAGNSAYVQERFDVH
jgi:hypothetical protein